MEKPQRSSAIVLLSIVVILLVIAFGAYIYFQNKPAQTAVTTPLSTATTAPTTTVATSATPSTTNSPTVVTPTKTVPVKSVPQVSTANWQTYTNSQYLFSFQYPSTYIKTTVAASAPGVPATALQPISLQTSGTQYDSGKASVLIASDANSVSECMTAPQSTETSISNVTTVTINGTSFLSFQAYSPAAGQFNSWQEYRALHSGKCFILSNEIMGIESNHISNPQQQQVANNEDASEQATLNSIAKTFRFN